MTRCSARAITTQVLGAALWVGGIAACGPEDDGLDYAGDASYLLPAGLGTIEFVVDSIVYDPAVGGTARDSTRSIWRLRRLDDTARVATDEALYEVDVLRDGRRIAGFLWAWEVRDRQSVNTLDNIPILGLIAPFSQQTAWDPLTYANPETVLSVAGEPVAAYKRWSGSIDSVGVYPLPDGSAVEAVWVTLADDENLLELREVSEVYGRDKGLLARSVRILDTQNTDAAVPWAIRAERGFEVYLTRR